MAIVDVTWSITAITVLANVYNMTALSWHGVLIAETARLSPPDQVGGVTGGVLAFTSIAMMIYPAIFGGIDRWHWRARRDRRHRTRRCLWGQCVDRIIRGLRRGYRGRSDRRFRKRRRAVTLRRIVRS